jgi:predicted transcriptional regulator
VRHQPQDCPGLPPLLLLIVMVDFTALSTPARDGETLVQPGPDALAGMAEANHRRLSGCACRIHGRPLRHLREATRAMITGGAPDAPIVVTGHQPEFYHAGVWAKNFVASRLAAALGGHAVNLVVDNDAPKKTTITVPHLRDRMLAAQEVPFAEYRVGWAFEQFDAIDARGGARLIDEIRGALGRDAYDASCLPIMEPALTSPERDWDLVEQVTAARKRAEQRFGLDLQERRVSQVWTGPLLLDILLNADRFAACYNAALQEYRQSLGISGPNRPVPDLTSRDDRIELPVWVYRRAQARRRLFLDRQCEKITLYADNDAIGSLGVHDLVHGGAGERLGAVLGWRFRPRALTLTLWARLLLADVFIHGIGGAKYDRITDNLIRRYFEIEPPGMACVSATIRMPMKRFGVEPADLIEARHRLRDVRYNPQRYLSAIEGGYADLVQQRVDAIAESTRLAREDPQNHGARRAVFQAIRRRNAQLLTVDPGIERRLAGHVGRIEQQLAHNRVADSRGYFFGLLPMGKLQRMSEALPTIDALR